METPRGGGGREPAGALCDPGRSPHLSEPGSSWLLSQRADSRIPAVSPRREGETLPCPPPPREGRGGRTAPATLARRHPPAHTWLRARGYGALLRPGPPGAQVTRVCATSGGRSPAGEPAGPGITRRGRKKARQRREPERGRPGNGLSSSQRPSSTPRKLSREPGPRPTTATLAAAAPLAPARAPILEMGKTGAPSPTASVPAIMLTVPGTRKCCSWY